MLNRDRVSKSGYYPLIIRVIHNRRKKLIYSSYRLKPEEFDDMEQKVIWNNTSPYTKYRVDEMNRFITSQKKEMQQLIERMERQYKGAYTADDMMLKYRKQSGDRYVFAFLEREITAKLKTNRHGTAAVYVSCRNSLRRFVGCRNITFKEINYKFVCDYIDHIRTRGVRENTVHMYLRNLRAICKKAQKQGVAVCKSDPFLDIRMSGVATVKRALPREVIKSIAELDLDANPNLDRVRNLFMFSFYTRGMSFVDMVYLKHSDISNGIIYYVRNKTKQNIQVSITPPLQKLIDKYRSGSIYVLPYLNHNSPDAPYHQYRKALSSINIYLKQIGEMIGLETALTTYVARHSWATIAKTQGASVASISEGLGHTTEQTTQIYLREFDKSVIDEINAKIVVL